MIVGAGRPAVAAMVLLALAGCATLPPEMTAAPPEPEGPTAELTPSEALPQPTGSWIDLGRRLLAANQPMQAEHAFIRSMRVEGMTATALTGAGIAAQRQGLLTEAVRYFERAKELDPASVAAHNNLGAALYGLGEIHAARQAFRTAFALSSGTSREAAQNLGMADLAVAQAEADAEPAADARNLQRTGSAQYKLIMASKTVGDEG